MRKKLFLPYVSTGSGDEVIDEINNKGQDDFTEGLLERLDDENPVLTEMIYNATRRNDEWWDLQFAGVAVYRMLEKAGNLPKPEKDTLIGLEADLLGGSVPEVFLTEIGINLKDQNPYIDAFLGVYSYSMKLGPIIYVGRLVYELLERQAKKQGLEYEYHDYDCPPDIFLGTKLGKALSDYDLRKLMERIIKDEDYLVADMLKKELKRRE